MIVACRGGHPITAVRSPSVSALQICTEKTATVPDLFLCPVCYPSGMTLREELAALGVPS